MPLAISSSLEQVGSRLTRFNNKWLITPKLMYLTMNMVVYTFHLFRGPFITGYLEMDKQDVGLLSTLMALVAFPSITMWSTVADRLGRHKIILSAITCGAVASFELLLVKFESKSMQFIFSTAMLMLYSCFLAGMQPLLDYAALEILSSKPGFSKEMYGRQRLWGTIAYTVITLGGAEMMNRFGGFKVLFLIMPTMAIIFIITLYFTAHPDKPKPWNASKQLLQSVADEKLNPSTNFNVSDPLNPNDDKSVTPHLLNDVPALTAEDKPTDAAKLKEMEETDVAVLKDGTRLSSPSMEDRVEGFAHRKVRSPWKTLLTDANYMFFLFVILMLGLARAVMTTFLPMFWMDPSGGLDMTKTEASYAGAIFGMLLEVVVFFVAKHISPLMGNYWMLVVAQLAMVVRCWAYYWIPTGRDMYWMVYLIELLKGLSFGLAHSAAIKIANEAAPEGLEATAQALYNSSYVQLPTVVAGLAGKWAHHVFHDAAAKLMFFGTAVISSTAFVLFTVKYSIDGKIRLKFW